MTFSGIHQHSKNTAMLKEIRENMCMKTVSWKTEKKKKKIPDIDDSNWA